MKFSSQSLAKTVLLVSLAIGSTSAWYGWKLHKEAPALRGSVKQSQAAAEDAMRASDELSKLPVSAVVLQDMDAALSSFMLQLMNSRARFGIEIGQTTTGKTGGSERMPVEELVDAVPDTPLRSVKVELSGTYSDYERFAQFLEYIRSYGTASIVHLKVKDNTYLMSVRVYGKS